MKVRCDHGKTFDEKCLECEKCEDCGTELDYDAFCPKCDYDNKD